MYNVFNGKLMRTNCTPDAKIPQFVTSSKACEFLSQNFTFVIEKIITNTCPVRGDKQKAID